MSTSVAHREITANIILRVCQQEAFFGLSSPIGNKLKTNTFCQ
ncbi:hypothetical protein RintRC_5769 [Richelia intracellularis]|nr:hypothetical protein RintRC_5769 [Richelia intracellularis]